MSGLFLILLLHRLCTAAALRMTGPSTYTARVGSIAHIPCTFTTDTLPADPRNFAVIWYFDGKNIISFDNTIQSTNPRYSLDEDRALNGNAGLTISNVSVSDAGEYECSVTDSPARLEKYIRVTIIAAALRMTGPSTYTASVGSIDHIPCTFTADTLPADPRNFAVYWYFDRKNIISFDNTIKSINPRYSLDEDQALNGNAGLTISNVSVSDAGDYECSVIYSPARLEKYIRVTIIATPSITILNKIVTKSEKSSLKSTTSGFYPVDIDIKWLRDGQTLDNVIIEKPQRNPDGTYSVNSSVIIIPTEEDRERIFFCRVHHKSLITPLQEDFQLVYSDSSSDTNVIIIVGPLLGVLVILTMIVGIYFWRKKYRRKGRKKVSENEADQNERLFSSIPSGAVRPQQDYAFMCLPGAIRTSSQTSQHISGRKEDSDNEADQKERPVSNKTSEDELQSQTSVCNKTELLPSNQQQEPQEDPKILKTSETPIESSGAVRQQQDFISNKSEILPSHQQYEPLTHQKYALMNVPAAPAIRTSSQTPQHISAQGREPLNSEHSPKNKRSTNASYSGAAVVTYPELKRILQREEGIHSEVLSVGNQSLVKKDDVQTEEHYGRRPERSNTTASNVEAQHAYIKGNVKNLKELYEEKKM